MLSRGVTQCGTAASVGVESTARQSYDLSLNVTIVLDVISDFNPAAKAACEANIYPMPAETRSLLEIIEVLNRISRA
ncbi:hypothetical protein RRU01S_27_00630 [Agrobacterium rubi TR3 = NBRC 13261]|uniref:Uncharacterized protein n=1 Tax=Agrobacterium rubi TR3 = NBRC 13261 TaxID=1368415 RepID=A0A081D179_9HYPH|nr:hypothetical protein RRU01S_27_00630 [Agrobacterium rubi TR3 = NBRC 13261]